MRPRSPEPCDPVHIWSFGGGAASLTFSDFTFTPSSTGGASTPSAAGTTYTLDDPGVGIVGEPIFGFEFNPSLSDSLTASQDIVISYLVVPTGTAINSIDLLENATASGSATGQVTDQSVKFCIASDPSNTSGTCRTFGAPPAVSTSTSLTHRSTFGNWTSMTVTQDINATGAGGTASISLVRDAVDLSTVPEPTTYGLVGFGLVAIGYFSRRRRTAPR